MRLLVWLEIHSNQCPLILPATKVFEFAQRYVAQCICKRAPERVPAVTLACWNPCCASQGSANLDGVLDWKLREKI